MTRHHSTKVKPYVYICIHKQTGKFYIGYREANVKSDRTSTEDFPLYRSSCKEVKLNFDEYDWCVLAEFTDPDAAYDCEQQMIFENWKDPLLLNKHCCHNEGMRFKRESPPWNKGTRGAYKRTKETIDKIKTKRALQIMQPSPHLGKTYEEMYGDRANDIKNEISSKIKSLNIKRTEEFKQNLRKPKPIVTCPHCGKEGGGGSMKQWHFDNCKYRDGDCDE